MDNCRYVTEVCGRAVSRRAGVRKNSVGPAPTKALEGRLRRKSSVFQQTPPGPRLRGDDSVEESSVMHFGNIRQATNYITQTETLLRRMRYFPL
jgi:hypothetical protein